MYHSSGSAPDLSSLSNPKVRDAAEVFSRARAGREVAVLLANESLLDKATAIRGLPDNVIVVAEDAETEKVLGDRVDLSLNGITDPAAKRRMLCAASNFSGARVAAAKRRYELTCTRRDLHELNQISLGLMHEQDQHVLIDRIVAQGKLLTESDAGCLFLLEREKDGASLLRPAVYAIDSIPNLSTMLKQTPPLPPLPLDPSSIIGYSALTKHHFTVEDAYNLPSDAPFVSNTEFEEQFGYYVKSLLVVPMLDRNDRAMGVLAFVNRKRQHDAVVRDKVTADKYVTSYTRREVRLARALGSVAAASIENTQLYAQIEKTLESMVKASVSAIDQRDPSTAGHSVRVAQLTCDLAGAVERAGTGPYRGLTFTRAQIRELRYAALLHDLGKVTVREDVLMKAKKLPPELWERVRARFNLIRQSILADHYRGCCGGRPSGREFTHTQSGVLDDGCSARLMELDRFWHIIRAANEPVPNGVMPADLTEIAQRTFEGPDRVRSPYITQDELRFLQIPHGTLDYSERGEIQSHVEQTYQFLLQIPWTDDLKNLATYARGHHEKLDGSGYPQGLKGDQIPVQTRIMTIADIFDALTAADRPYKRAVSADKALDIIRSEARAGQLDTELVRVLVDSKVYQHILR
ncbi:MAG: GAF and HD-GYP domain-containing protein [Gemmatimonadaceae bacterium]